MQRSRSDFVVSSRLNKTDFGVSWVITQTEKELTIEEKVTGGNPPMNGGGTGPGGPGRGMGGFGGPRIFNLNGSETSGEMGRGKFVRKATVSGDGKTIELSSKMTFQGQEGEVTSNSTDKLQLSADGKTLTVNRHSESPRGNQDSTLIFNK